MAEFTPGLQRRFAGLDPGFTDRQWPGFGPRSHPFGLAGTYVFIKQSGPPCHCDLRVQGYPLNPQAPLLPKLRGQFAEFPFGGGEGALRKFEPRIYC